MKKYFPFIISALLLLTSCNPREIYHYVYETQPEFGWGYAEYWGKYYQKYDINNSVISLSLFSDSLTVDSTGSLQGFGQYIYLEDVFMGPNDILMPDGNFEISADRDSMSITPGEVLKIDGVDYTVGALLYYFEKDQNLTKSVKITGGSMDVSTVDTLTTVLCHFELEDGTSIEGTYQANLPYYDESFINVQDHGIFGRTKRVDTSGLINP